MSHPLFVIDLDGDVADEDIQAVCQPDPWEHIVRITEPRDASMEALAAMAGVFPSRGQARKNGFAGPVPHGLELWGTSQRTFWCWNPKHPAKPPTIGKKRRKTAQWVRVAMELGWLVGPDGTPWPMMGL